MSFSFNLFLFFYLNKHFINKRIGNTRSAINFDATGSFSIFGEHLVDNYID